MCSPHTPLRDRRKVPTVTIHTMFKNILENPPMVSEGFSSVEKVNFTLKPAKDEVEHYLYDCFLL